MDQVKEPISLVQYITDNLTGLFSHSYFHGIFPQEVKRARTCNRHLSLALLNLDCFSSYNTLHGYFQGDTLLKEVAELIRRDTQSFGTACRYKEDEFAIILPRMNPDEALSAMDQIRCHVFEAFHISSDHRCEQPITLSVGISSLSKDTLTANELIAKAQQALYQAKVRGKNRCLLYQDVAYPSQNQQAIILIVDDMNCNINYIEDILTPFNYTFIKATDGLEALSLVHRQKPDLILMDVMMPNLNGYEVCRQLKEDQNTRLIPIILITSLSTLQDKITGIEAGADDYLIKPFQKAELAARVKSLLRVKNLNDHLESQENVIFSLARAIEAKDKYTLGHTERVTGYALTLGEQIGLDDLSRYALKLGGVLHDIGKIGIPESILNKPGPLNPQEWEAIQKHPEIGFSICFPLKDKLGEALSIIRHHHEKMNGTGYPDRLKGEAIPLVARIMAIADIYDALTTDRPYRKRLSKKEALEILQNEADRGLLDRELVDQFGIVLT
ncbi:MAG: HD domain-containing phosphohydrolase [bacterium]